MRNTRTGRITAGISTLLLMAACGGGGGGEPPNVAPIANAGVARTVDVGNVTLNGTASSDSDGTIASYAWTQTAGAAVTLNAANTSQPNFRAPQNTSAAVFSFQLIVTDNRGATSGPSTVTITVNGNALPVANAGAAQTVPSGSEVILNGTASSDPDGTIGSWSWTQTSGGAVTLNNAGTSAPRFTAPVASTASTLTFRLIVTDNRGVAGPEVTATVNVNANLAPVANAGPTRTVASGAFLSLNGSGSTDADGTITSYVWSQIAGPAVVLSNPAMDNPSFTAPVGTVASTLTFRLVVTDNAGATSAASTVTITVNANLAPVANAGPTQTVQAGAAVILNGSASSDSDGTIASYAWTQTSGTAVTLNNASVTTPSFTAPVGSSNTTLIFRLIVTDNTGAVSTPATVTINVLANFLPVAIAGSAQTHVVGAAISLDGSASFDSGGSIASYAWTQTSGTAVVLNGASTARPTFAAPGTPATLVFSLVVTDNFGAVSSPSTVTIAINSGVTMSGTIRFQRVPFIAGPTGVLDYANPVWQPARGITVNATMIGGAIIVGTAVTDSSGNYSMTVPSSLNINVRAVAEMVRSSPQPLPRWNMRVQDGITLGSTYSYFIGTVNSNAGTHNIDIPSGISASGTRTLGRNANSGPYAILDTVYKAMQKVTGVAPSINFPDLYLNWGGQSEGTYFDTQDGQHIALLSDVTQDPDEFDQHIIAHEFGHYIEQNFSRADNIGGSHGPGDKLDMRVAFGEGFGSAFAAIVLDDPLGKDSFVLNGVQRVSTFDMEINPSGAAGCWCSESSVWSILWDLYDNVPDGSDNISLPFSAIWDVLVNQQRTTPSVTSIFSFSVALKVAQPAFAGLINSLTTAQNINSSSIDEFAANETYLPFAGMTVPLVPVITRGGGPVVVRSIDDGGHYNKAGNIGYLRFVPTATGAIQLTVTTSNVAASADPDFIVWRSGVLHTFGTNAGSSESRTFSVTAGQTYIIEAYECSNGCFTQTGIPGDYNLTVTIN